MELLLEVDSDYLWRSTTENAERTSGLVVPIPTDAYDAMPIPKVQGTSWKKAGNTVKARGPGCLWLDSIS